MVGPRIADGAIGVGGFFGGWLRRGLRARLVKGSQHCLRVGDIVEGEWLVSAPGKRIQPGVGVMPGRGIAEGEERRRQQATVAVNLWARSAAAGQVNPTSSLK